MRPIGAGGATRGYRKRAATVAGHPRPAAEGPVVILEPMLKQGLRLLLFRFLPRRLVPLLAAVEVVRLIQRLRRGRPEPDAPRRLVTADRPDHTAP